MPRIDDLEFAKLVTNGAVYRAPCIVYRNSVNGRWWRTDGARFLPEDFTPVVEANPDVVVLGRGVMNMVQIPEDTVSYLESSGARVEVHDSKEAAERYNELFASGENVVGAFHLM
ncbi:MAG: MTH938/NDUFAF3 family protein [Spirochaetaceae bacterium]